MSNILKIIAILSGLLIGTYAIARITKVLEVFKLPTSSMAPTFDPGKIVYATNLITPMQLDIVAYRVKPIDMPGKETADKETRVSRIIAKGGDQLQVIDGHTIVNGENIEKDIPLLFLYKTKDNSFDKQLISNLKEYQKAEVPYFTALYLTEKEKEILSTKIEIEKAKFPSDYYQNNSRLKDYSNDDWTVNNLGPLTIPEGHFFVMGDNRDNSEDSRILGFIPIEDILYYVFP